MSDPVKGRDTPIFWKDEYIAPVEITDFEFKSGWDGFRDRLVSAMGLPEGVTDGLEIRSAGETVSGTPVLMENYPMATRMQANDVRLRINGEDVGRGDFVISYDDSPLRTPENQSTFLPYSSMNVDFEIAGWTGEYGPSPLPAIRTLQQESEYYKKQYQAAVDMDNRWREGSTAPREIREMCIALWKGDVDSALPLIDRALDEAGVMDHIVREIKRKDDQLAEAMAAVIVANDERKRLEKEVAGLKKQVGVLEDRCDLLRDTSRYKY